MIRPQAPADARPVRDRLLDDLERARRRTTLLTQSVEDGDLVRQHSPLMSPLVWDLAHVGNQEELWLLRDVGGREPMLPSAVDDLYDAFRHPRGRRPELPLLDPRQARRYVHEVRGRVVDLLATVPLHDGPLDGGPFDDAPLDAHVLNRKSLTHHGFAFAMIVQHEQQHDETMLATHQLRAGSPVLSAPAPSATALRSIGLEPGEVLVPGGAFEMGTSSEPWALDNERPSHRVDLAPFWIDTLPVTNRDYQHFIADGGYHDARWWTPQGWAHRQQAGLTAPLFWWREGGAWLRRRFGREEPVPALEPVAHVCWYEADAYARWSGKRLPTEAEWEKAARWDPATDRSRRYPWGDDDPGSRHANLGQRHLQPAPVGAYPLGASPLGVQQLIGDLWEWTATGFAGYPGFTAWPYREYSEVFFGKGYRVLRGGSFGTDAAACRATFRNWDLPVRRQIFSGFRCARDARPAE